MVTATNYLKFPEIWNEAQDCVYFVRSCDETAFAIAGDPTKAGDGVFPQGFASRSFVA
jgi:hypothetical protein